MMFSRVHTRWSLDHLGEVKRILIGPNEFFYFSFSKIIPYSDRPEVWGLISEAGAAAFLNDPDFNEGLITFDSPEFPFQPENAENENNANNAETSSGTSEFGAH